MYVKRVRANDGIKIEKFFVPAGNEPSSRACADIWRMARGSNMGKRGQ